MPTRKPTNTRKTSTTRKSPAETPETIQPLSDDKYAPTAWGGSAYEDVPLPSGQLCLARRLGVEGLVKAGIVHDIDPLMGMVQMHEARMEGKGAESNEKMAMDLMKDEDKMASLFHMLDRIVCATVVKPHVEMAPNDITRRKDGVVYTDMVQMQDKMHLMMWSMGGAEALAGFREQYEGTLASLSAKPEDGDKAE